MGRWTVFIFVMLSVLLSCSEDEPVRLRVMSYNIAAGYGDLARIAEVIAEQNPDLVALQEVDVHWSERSLFEDQASRLAELLQMNHFFGEIYELPSDSPGGSVQPRRYGLAILSRFPFQQTENHHLTRLSTVEEGAVPRPMPGFPEVVVRIDGRPVRFFSTHLDYRSDPAVRRLQVDEMLEIIGTGEPVLLLGDLNARPESPELAPLFDRLRDSWQGREEPGYTFPSDGADRRIDYILHSDNFEVLDVRVVQTPASDHLPVVADLRFAASGEALSAED